LDSTKLAKYTRCLFQIALSGNSNIAEQLIEQISYLAQDAAEVRPINVLSEDFFPAHSSKQTDLPYPAEELEWVATRAFNHAVDLYCSGDDDGCKKWAAQSLNIAHFCPDGGVLESLLQSKYAGLKFDGE
jgi:hypothetical protein